VSHRATELMPQSTTVRRHRVRPAELADCPWINGPVGLHNERYFTLFMVYLAVGLGCVVVWAWKPMLRSVFDHRTPWPHYTPRACTLMLWILAVALGLAIVIMALWQLWSIGRGETSVEANDNGAPSVACVADRADFYRSLAKARGHVYINPFDLGWRNNLRFFFGIGPNRSVARYDAVLMWQTALHDLDPAPVSAGVRRLDVAEARRLGGQRVLPRARGGAHR